MDINFLLHPTPSEIALTLAANVRARRKERRITQRELAALSGVSLGSLKRFEGTGEISLKSLINIAVALGCESDFQALFSKKRYASIEDVINERG